MRAKVGGSGVVPLIVTVLLATAVSGAGEGRNPVFNVTVIDQAGHYVVTRDISTASGFPIVTIGGSGCTPFGSVTLDLNGRTLTSGAAVIGINSNCASGGVTVRNGRIVGGGAGSAVGGGVLSAAATPLDLRLENVEIAHIGGDAVHLAAARVVHVEGCYIHDVGGTGISISGQTAPFQGTFIDNTLTAIGDDGIGLEGLRGGAIKANVISNYGLDRPDSAGIRLSSTAAIGTVGGTLVEGNTLSSLPGGTDDLGLIVNGLVGAACPHNQIVGNIIQGNGSNGALIASDGNRIERNVLSRNLVGMQVGIPGGEGARNHLEANSFQNNMQCGLLLGNGLSHTYRNSIGGGNGASGAPCFLTTGNIDLGGNSGL